MRRVELLRAMRADRIPSGSRGLWSVRKMHDDFQPGCGVYTFLKRWTEATLHLAGETVMSDDARELSRHLEAVYRARGRVLITGLGLGCVLRGVLTRSQVTQVDVVERSRDVIELVWPHIPADPRVRLHHGDARRFEGRGTWDVAWHDLWTPGNDGLQPIHAELMMRFRGRVRRWQGAWGFPREYREIARRCSLEGARA